MTKGLFRLNILNYEAYTCSRCKVIEMLHKLAQHFTDTT